ncbi:ATP-binding cassette domain-containing protein [Streptomyces olivaceus]|uniref:ATP-binding cassette domain-containing protein n=1 Tax=Streptomyces olivaceus TaxID=47716 RepID=A0ABS7WDD8_STROV|nr:ATP-binding cassette domain-containing protein [Streptomyces olivaceus]MBZ6092701.1 ATP-binding cassette domain-containing protein [Streptomyces olivaceus]MBZ6099574.1 ATP-binding cassette domain-containing protein [Streptomyces olivaceus]MBZ6120545.1 ATP-binding cassette domain-containing protein [Streptomyces olivaceus]MBZ6155523.1 ATP-binding cassette domain-containing protein [Streptomyces olivaceus]MBZ6204009.1 ATP-binding cassette domain-containing protein [Streptomyces olivaceus]
MIQAFGLTSTPRKELPPAVDDVSFEARAGRVTALLGAPGAGKTTALRLMLELQHGRGLTYFRGRPLHRIAHPSHEVGVLLGDVPGHPSRTVRGHVRMLCAAAGVPVRRADEVLESVDLASLRDERLGTLSRGMDRRLGLACALVPDPHTLVFDDPAGALSAHEARWLHGTLRAHADQGGTVLFSTADPKEAARTADHVVTLEGGRVVADQEAADFSRTRLRPRVAVRTPHAARLAALLAKEARAARRSVEVVPEAGNRLAVYGSTCADIGETAFRHRILVHQLADEIGDMGPGAGPATGPRHEAVLGGRAPAPRRPTVTRPSPTGPPRPTATDASSTDPPGSPGDCAPQAPSRADTQTGRQAGPRAPSHSDAQSDGQADTQATCQADGQTGPQEPPSANGPADNGPATRSEAVPAAAPGEVTTPDHCAEPDHRTVPNHRTAPDHRATVGHPQAAADGPPEDGDRPAPRNPASAGVRTSPGTPADAVRAETARTPSSGPAASRSALRPFAVLTSRPGTTAARDTAATLPPPITVRSAPSPLRPLRYELRRTVGVGTGFVTGAVVLLVSAVTAVVLARVGHTPQERLLAAWPRELPLPPAALGAGLLGALAFGDEFRHPALAADRGTVPRRMGLLTAKLLVSAVVAVLLAVLTVGSNAELLHLFYGREVAALPADWPTLGAGWLGFVVGCAWSGVLAAGIFRSTTAGLAAVVAVPVVVVPLVQRVWAGPSVRTAAGLPMRVRETLLTQWPFGGERYVGEVLRMLAQPVGGALTLSLTTLLCAYLLMTLRGRVR